MKLPSQQTLRDYTHYIKAATGFSTEVEQMVLRTAKVGSCPEREKCSELILIGAPFMSFLFLVLSIFRLVSFVVLPHVPVQPVFDYLRNHHVFIDQCVLVRT